MSIAALALFVGEEGVFPSSDHGQDKTIQVSFVTVEKGFSSGVRERRFAVIKAREELEKLWRVHGRIFSLEKKIPPVDFEQEMILMVFSGEKRTGGYGIEITKVEEDMGKAQLRVFYRETQPLPNSMVVQVLTQPYHVVKVKKIDFPVIFVSGQEPSRP